jgi:hypothetical protein
MMVLETPKTQITPHTAKTESVATDFLRPTGADETIVVVVAVIPRARPVGHRLRVARVISCRIGIIDCREGVCALLVSYRVQ